jgi:hypothetical protein
MNPVFYHSGGRIQDKEDPEASTSIEPEGWYFWTETWADYCGPYSSEEAANYYLTEYAKQL